MVYSQWIKKVWLDIYDPHQDCIATIEKYFHADFEQCINGVMMRRNEYMNHVQEQKRNMTVTDIKYENMLENKNELFAIYYPTGTNKSHSPVEAEVIAYFRFEKDKIIQIHGQVRLIKGNLEDVDMEEGGRYKK